MSDLDLEKQSTNGTVANEPVRVQFDNVAPRGRQTPHTYSEARPKSLSRSLSRSRVRDPDVILPTVFRTVSYGVDDQINERDSKHPRNAKLLKSKKTQEAVDTFVETEWHALSAGQVLAQLDTSMELGLTAQQVQDNLKTFGPNSHSPPPNHLFRKILMYCFGGFGSLLLGGGVLCCVSWKPLGNPNPAPANLALGVVLIIVFFIQAAFNAWQDFSSLKVMDSISNLVPESTLVIRGGVREEISTKDLVPGDRVTVKAGNKVSADVRIIEASQDLKFDQSLLTGESKAIEGLTITEEPGSNYLEAKCIALQGSYCLTGTAHGIVVSTGDNTVFGSIAKLSSAPKHGLTPIQKEILRFVLIIVAVIVAMIIVIIICWYVYLSFCTIFSWILFTNFYQGLLGFESLILSGFWFKDSLLTVSVLLSPSFLKVSQLL